MKSIVFVINSLSKFGGSERVATILGNSLSSQESNVHIVTGDMEGTSTAFPLVNGVALHQLSAVSPYDFFSKTNDLIRRINPEKVVVHNMGRLALLLAFLSRPPACEFIVLEHVSYKSASRIVKILKHLLYFRYSAVVALTTSDMRNYKIFAKKTYVIPNPSPFTPELRQYNSESKIAVAVGRLTHQKGFDLLIKSWALVENRLKDWELHIYGDGECRSELEKMVNRLNLRRVVFMGQVSNMRQVYEKAAMYLLSSRYEGLPMVLIEAQTFGLPIVSFDCPEGPGDIVVDGVNGELIACFNLSSFAMAVERLAKDADTRAKYAREARTHSKKFELDSIVNLWKGLLNVD